MSSLLVTGLTGSLGQNLLPALLASGHKIYSLTRTTSDTSRFGNLLSKVEFIALDENWKDAVKQLSVDYVLHMATDYGRGSLDLKKMTQTNIIFPLELLQLVMEMEVSPVFINMDTSLERDVSTYSLSKKQFLQWLKFYRSEITIVNLVLEYFYGEANQQFLPMITRKLINKEPKVDLTIGTQKRDFFHLDDLIQAILIILDKAKEFDSDYTEIEIGSGSSVSIRHVIELVKSITGNSETVLNWGAVPLRENETLDSCAQITFLENLGWSASVSLEQGLAKLVQKVTVS